MQLFAHPLQTLQTLRRRAAAAGQPEKVREKALRALASLARDEGNQVSMWQTAALVAAVRAGAADGQSEAICRAVCHTGLKPKGPQQTPG